MKLDLEKDMRRLRKHIAERVSDYPVYINEGPGKDADDITQLTLGYQFDQDSWVSLVFDTRPGGGCDGEWHGYIEETAEYFADWHNASTAIYEDGKRVPSVLPGKKKKTLTANSDLAEVIGECLRDLLLSCNAKGVFDSLPIADDCRLTVEEHDGQFGWSEKINGEDDDEEDEGYIISDATIAKVSKLSKTKQIAYWLSELETLSKLPGDTEHYTISVCAEQLGKVGKAAVEPAMKFVLKWAGKDEYDFDKPDSGEPLPHSIVSSHLFSMIEQIDHGAPAVEKLLRQIVVKSLKVNQKRTLWGTTPFYAARAMFNLFKGYPCPELGDTDNALVDPAPFVGGK